MQNYLKNGPEQATSDFLLSGKCKEPGFDLKAPATLKIAGEYRQI